MVPYTNESEQHGCIQPGNWWRYSITVQLEEARRAVREVNNMMMRWNEGAARDYEAGKRSAADEVLAALWESRKLKMNRLKWIRSWLLDQELAEDVSSREGRVKENG